MVEAKTHCYGWRQTRQQKKLGRNRGIPKTQRVLASTNIWICQVPHGLSSSSFCRKREADWKLYCELLGLHLGWHWTGLPYPKRTHTLVPSVYGEAREVYDWLGKYTSTIHQRNWNNITFLQPISTEYPSGCLLFLFHRPCSLLQNFCLQKKARHLYYRYDLVKTTAILLFQLLQEFLRKIENRGSRKTWYLQAWTL